MGCGNSRSTRVSNKARDGKKYAEDGGKKDEATEKKPSVLDLSKNPNPAIEEQNPIKLKA